MRLLKPIFVYLFYFYCVTGIAQVAPFLTTTWDQGCNYNASCPVIPGGQCGRAFTGCNATAFAQVCKYYNFPLSGMGSHSYTPPGLPTQSVNFAAAVYNYSAMPPSLSSANANVADLMYHCGVAANMAYGATSSGSLFSPEAWKRYFKYSPKMYSTATYMFPNTNALIAAIKAELNAGRPVFAKGNHFYLIDGYNASNQFHVNFGWGGTSDGYYPINNITTSWGNWTPTTFLFMVRPIGGTMETESDTIFAPAYPTNPFFGFTSLSNWTITTSASWLTSNLTTGSTGYYNGSDSCMAFIGQNPGPVRYGYIFINNGSDIDTVVVKQDVSELQSSQDTLNFQYNGSSQSSTITAPFWMSWAASATSWINLNSTGGTGNGTLIVSPSVNSFSVSRTGSVVISSGLYTQTIIVNQEAAPVLNALPDTLSFPDPGGTQLAPVISNMNWTVTTSTSWVTLNSTSGSGSNTLAITVSANTGSVSRFGNIVLYNGTVNDTIVIYQYGLIITEEKEYLGCEDKVKLFPDPAVDKIYIKTKDNSTAIKRITVFDSRGALIRDIEMEAATAELQITDLKAGLYFVKVNGIYIGRFMKTD